MNTFHKYFPEVLLPLAIAHLVWCADSWVSLCIFALVFVTAAGKQYLECYASAKDVAVPSMTAQALESELSAVQKSLQEQHDAILILQSSVSKLSLTAGFKPFGQKP